MNRYPHRSHRSRGNTLIQMVLCTPLLVMLTFGLVEYSYFYWVKSCLRTSAAAGARAAIESNATNATVTTTVQNAMQSYGFQSTAYTVTTLPANLTGLPTGQQITVTLSSTWGPVGVHVLPAGFGRIPDNKQVISAVVMNRE